MKISPAQISYIAIACLLFIFTTQFYLVGDYFNTTRAGLIRESNTIIEQAFRQELNLRHKIYKHRTGEDTITTPPPPTSKNVKKFNGAGMKEYSGNMLGLLDLAINSTISEIVPLDIHSLDSVTRIMLNKRNINSAFILKKTDKQTGKIQLSQAKFRPSFLQIESEPLRIDFENKLYLQLILINPFGLLLKRMGIMLLSSLVLSVICVLAFRFLLRVLAKQKQLVAFKNEFLGTIAHELKRPVASLAFNLDCLGTPAIAANAQQHELLVGRSVQATTELNDTISMIVALAKLEEGLLELNKEPVNLSRLFEELKKKFTGNPAKVIDIQTVCELDSALVTGDSQLLSQCFANLLDNSIKYSDREVLIVVTLRQSGRWIVVSIKDNGYGIPEEKLPVIFDKYARAHTENTKINGFGIGLNYVKTIVEKHQGAVEVKSRQGEGSEFSVLLPK